MSRGAIGRGLLLAVVVAGWPALARASATFVIQNLDDAGEGFNDPTPATPVGGNPGTTIGQQRLNAFNEATSIWGKLIDSYVPIVIAAQFSPLSCSATSTTLGQARAAGLEANQPGLPPNILVPEPLADRLAGYDINPGLEDIDAMFNGDLLGCSNGLQDWYYGFDGKPPGDDIDLVSVLLHEFGHGLGFLSGVDSSTGELAGGFLDTFTAHLYDNEANMLWSNMTDDERAASAQNIRHLVWQGDNVTKMAAIVLATGAPRVTPAPLPSGLLGALAEANYGPFLSAGSVRGPIVVGNPVDGCNYYPPSYEGQVILFQGGNCPGSFKASIAETAGALAVLISDPSGLQPPATLEDPPDQIAMFPVHIPVIGVTEGDADLLSATTETATMDADGSRLVGADAQGRMYMYASNPILPASTVSHWDPLARPDLMQEPVASYTVSHDLRMEAALMRDIGWAPFCGNSQIDQQEQCDNGAANSDTAPNACRTDCLLAHCGDGVVDSGEACDNGAANSDTASGACRTSCIQPSCGDGVVDPGEACDNGATNSDTASGACRTTCVKASCGDGVVDPGEQCDNGAANAAGAACGTNCNLPGSNTGNGGSGAGNGGSGAGNGGSSGGTTGETGGGGCKCAIGENRRPEPVTLALTVGLCLMASRRRRSNQK